MTGLRYSPLHGTELCGEMQGKFKVGRARLIKVQTDKILGSILTCQTVNFLTSEILLTF